MLKLPTTKLKIFRTNIEKNVLLCGFLFFTKNMNELKEPWIDKYLIHSYEVDRDSCLSIVSAINYFQESAWRNADSLGVGFNDLAAKNRFNSC